MTYPMNDPNPDDWQELRCAGGHKWGEYSPSRRAVRFERRKGKGTGLRAIIPLDPYHRG